MHNRMGTIMNARSLFVLCIAALGAAVAGLSQAASPPAAEGLMPVRSWNLDELYLRPNADLAGYRKVLIDPVQVAFRSDWNRDFADPHAALRRLSQDDVRRITDETASGLQSAIADTFRARGYQIVAAPGPGVLRLSPSLADLYVNAAEELQQGGTTKSFTKDAGEATFVLDVRDAATGTLLGRVVDRRTVRETKGTQIRDVVRTSRVSNNFWFEETFRRWAVACVTEFETAKS
jgi:hypothetical protein